VVSAASVARAMAGRLEGDVLGGRLIDSFSFHPSCTSFVCLCSSPLPVLGNRNEGPITFVRAFASVRFLIV